VRSLQVYVHGLRRALGPERIETHGPGTGCAWSRASSTSTGWRASSREAGG
jgi:hypothetical protein